jgi:hypothetical protein
MVHPLGQRWYLGRAMFPFLAGVHSWILGLDRADELMSKCVSAYLSKVLNAAVADLGEAIILDMVCAGMNVTLVVRGEPLTGSAII